MPGKLVAPYQRFRRFIPLSSLAAITLFLNFFGGWSHGQVIYQYEADFSGAAGTVPEDWATQTAGAGTTFTLNGSNQFSYSTHAASAGIGMAYWKGSLGEGAIENGQLTNVTVTTLLGWPPLNTYQSTGILARVDGTTTPGHSPNGYFAGIYHSGNPKLIIAMNPSGDNFGTILGTLDLTGERAISTNSSYLLTVTAIGDQLTATLFDTEGTHVIGSISVTDSTYTTGYFGLRARAKNQNRVFSYSSYQIDVHAIPEPSSTAMLSLVVGGLLVFQFRRNQCATS